MKTKTNKIYYCPICNFMSTNESEVIKHITEQLDKEDSLIEEYS